MIRNLDYIRAKDPKLFEALSDLIQHNSNVEQQTNANRTGQPLPPPSIDGVTVTGQNGHFHVQINHKAEIYRGVQYYAEFANNPGFASPHTIHMGDSREHTQFLGNGTYYWRAYAAYASSGPSSPAYHGGSANPQPVSGGGSIGGPALLAPQGSGTGLPGEGLSGPGPIPFRSTSGAPPVRGQSIDGGAAGGGGSPGGSLLPSPSTGLPAGLSSLGSSSDPSSSISESVIAQSENLTGVTGTNAITAATAIPYTSLAVGFVVRLIPAHTNTGAVTLSVNSIVAAAVTKNGSTALTGGELQIARTYFLLWDGTRWQIIGPSFPVSAAVLASDANGNPSAAALTDGKLWIGNGSNLPIAQTISGDGTISDAGVFAIVPATGTFTPVLSFGGASTGITYSTQTGTYYKIGKLTFVRVSIVLTSKGSSTGLSAIAGFPFTADATLANGLSISYANNIGAIVGQIVLDLTGTTVNPFIINRTGGGTTANLLDTDFTNTTTLNFSGVYQAA